MLTPFSLKAFFSRYVLLGIISIQVPFFCDQIVVVVVVVVVVVAVVVLRNKQPRWKFIVGVRSIDFRKFWSLFQRKNVFRCVLASV